MIYAMNQEGCKKIPMRDFLNDLINELKSIGFDEFNYSATNLTGNIYNENLESFEKNQQWVEDKLDQLKEIGYEFSDYPQ